MLKLSFESNIKKMYLMRFLYNLHFISAVLVPFFTDWGGLKFSWVLLLNAWFFFWIFLLEIPTGTVADFLGRKASMITGCVIGIGGVLFYASFPSLLVFLVAEVILAVSFTLLSGADEAFAYDTLKELDREGESKKVFSNMESFKLAGIVVGAVAGGLIAKKLGVRMPMLLQSIPLGICFFLCLTFKEPQVAKQKKVLTFKAYKKILMDGVKFFMNHRILKILTLDMVFVFAIAWLIIWFYQALLIKAGVDLAYFGMVHAFMSVIQIIIINNFIRLEGWLGSKKRLLFVGAFMTGVVYIVLSQTVWAPLVITGIIFAAGFGLSRGPLFSNYMNKHIPSDKRATILSTTSMFRTFAIVIVEILSGVLAEWSIPGTLLIFGIAAIAFAFFSGIEEEYLID